MATPSGMTLRDLSDVSISKASLADKSFLVYDTGTGKFGARVIADSDIPSAIARDSEVTTAVGAANHWRGVSASTPGTPAAGDLWIDSTAGYVVKIYNGTDWLTLAQPA